MSAQTLDLLFGVTGQSLTFDAPEGRPSSVTSSAVYESVTGDDGTAETATQGSAAVETTPSTTFSSASGVSQANPKKCNVTATTGCAIGRAYLATNALGEHEWVEVTGISSAAYVVAREPLQNDYAAADTFVSTRIAHALSSTWIAETSNLSDPYSPNARYRWRLVYVAASVTCVHDVGVDLLRYAARHDVTGLDVERRFPSWLEKVSTDQREDQGASVIAEAFQHVKFDLYNLSTADQSVRSREGINELVKLAAGAMVLGDEQTWRLYNDRLSQLVAWAKLSVQTDASGASAQPDVRPIWRR